MVVSAEEVSASLVREYLSRKGLKRTITCMDEEHPRTDSSINNRSLLRQTLHIEGLYRENKIQSSPLKTLLEIIVKHHIESCENDKMACNKSDAPPSALTVSSVANSPVAAPSQMNGTNTEHTTAAFVSSYPITLRSQVGELCPSQPAGVFVSLDTDRLSNHTQTGSWADDSEDQKGQPLIASLQDNEKSIRSEPDKRTSVTESIQRSRPNRVRRGMMSGPIASTPQESSKKRQSRRAQVPQLLRKEEANCQSWDGLSVTGFHKKSLERSEIGSTDHIGRVLQSTPDRMQSENGFEKVGQGILKTRKLTSLTRPNAADLDVSEMVLDDVDDDDDLRELSKVSFQKTIAARHYLARPMDQHTALDLKAVLLGSFLHCFSDEWRSQGFTFSERHDLRYGIVQKKGGPCGVLASIQAFVLKKMLFENTDSSNTDLQRLRPSNSTRRKCLVLAAAEILWRAGEEKQATLAINSGRDLFTPTGHYKSEGVLEKITCFTVDNIRDLQKLLEQHIEQFETGVLGCVLLTISAVLSRSVEKVREDMDVSTTSLIGAHGYCTQASQLLDRTNKPQVTSRKQMSGKKSKDFRMFCKQELVNLLLCGRAVSNVFDNDIELDSGNGSATLLKGIKDHCNIGLLSLFEHYNICKVGRYLKTPLHPIWVVCSESHFSLLFGLQRELLTNQDKGLEFDLYYYDGLANQQEEIRLTVSFGESPLSCQDVDADLIPPLEHCIRTRWKDALINWNDTEPIL